MRYLPHTPEDMAAMLEAVGSLDLDGLCDMIPEDCRTRSGLNVPEPMTEMELIEEIGAMAGNMGAAPEYKVFFGAGSYERFIPASVGYLLGRSEFSTAYTPYQPEVSQGTLQAIFEYQTLISRLLGLEVANASVYDGAMALAEALLMALRITKQKKIALSRAIHPLYRQVVQTYLAPTGFEILELPYGDDGRTDPAGPGEWSGLGAVAVQSPNFFGCIEDLKIWADLAHEHKALFVTSFSEPLAYGLLKSPGQLGADIACGEGQGLGVPQSFGGPGLGVFASKMKYVRNMPGRLVGMTEDLDGQRGFVLTLATREQHIRRAKATSNICTNNSLCALNASMYMAALGATGLREVAALNRDKAEYLKGELKKAGLAPSFSSPTFNEFVVRFPDGFEKTHEQLLEKKIVAGLPLAPYYPELTGHYLLGVTETKTKADMDTLVREVRS